MRPKVAGRPRDVRTGEYGTTSRSAQVDRAAAVADLERAQRPNSTASPVPDRPREL
jgi:hypothetical protein